MGTRDMPGREGVEVFIASVVDDPVKAIADYYYEDASPRG
jgi:hypothetical protein